VFFFVPYQDKANAHKKLLDDAELDFTFNQQAQDLVTLLTMFLYLEIYHTVAVHCPSLWIILWLWGGCINQSIKRNI